MAATTSAVYIKDAYKHYGPKTGPKRKQVLDGLSMNVHRGSIYGLLGASGCGKTTLLSCIVGRRLLNTGEIWVLGGTPGTEGSGVPGPRIGYMPQETALIGEFTVRGIVTYFGRICGMGERQIGSRFAELSRLLDLPPEGRLVGECSGGQQRRVSFAAALVHEPELLILDEPTVGLDPVLRERIWEYLVEITVKNNICVIITTHYIEECRQAHKIGLMRQGRLLAEESPDELIRMFRADTLEEVFLELSRRQAEGSLEQIQNTAEATPALPLTGANSIASLEQGNGSTNFLTEKPKIRKKRTSSYEINPDRLKALFLKNWLQYFRNYGGVAFTVIFPVLQMTIFFLAIGGDPKNLPMAFVNDENGTCANFDPNSYISFNNDSQCEFKNLGCRFLQEVEDPMFYKIFYSDVETAIRAVQNGKVHGVVYIPKNYTDAAHERAFDARYASDETLENGEVKVWLDMSNRQIGPQLKYKLLKKYTDFQKNLLHECHYNAQLGEIPVRFKEPVFGNDDDSYTIFMVPGFLITVIFFLSTMMTSTIMINDRLEGVWDRTLVAGATTMEILTAHVVTQFVIISFQVLELMMVCFVAFGAEVTGSMFDVVGLMMTQGISGMCYGFMISIVCASHTQANFISTGSFYPMLIISGVMWPVECMPYVLRILSRILPFTIPIDALRSVMKKGWDVTHMLVLDAYAICAVWSVVYILFSFYLLKIKM